MLRVQKRTYSPTLTLLPLPLLSPGITYAFMTAFLLQSYSLIILSDLSFLKQLQ